MNRHRKFIFSAFFLLLAATITLYGMTSLVPRSKGGFPVVSGSDGAYYTLRLKTALEGDPVISCPFDPHLRSFSTFIPSFMENTWASVLRPFVGTDISLAMTITYLTLPAVLFVLLVGFLYLIFSNGWLALILGFWGVLEGGTYFWKPFLLGIPDPSEPLPYFRYANPMLFQIPYLLAFGGLLHLFQTQEKRGQHGPHPWLTLGVIGTGGLLFYVQVYYSVIFMTTLGIFAAISAFRNSWNRVRLILVVIFGALIIGAPELIQGINLLVAPGILDVVHRIGCLIRSRNPYFMLHKGLIITFVVYQILCWKRWTPRWKILTSSMLAGYGCLNQSIITGLSSHDHHYFRPLMVTYIFVVADIFVHVFQLWPKILLRRRLLIVSGCLVCILISAKAAYLNLNIIHHKFQPGVRALRATQFKETVAAIQNIPAEEKGAILANPDYTYIIEILGNARVFIDEYFYHCITSDDLLFRRWALLRKIYGWNQTTLTSFLRDFVDKSNLNYWLYGLPATYLGQKNSYTAEEKDRRIDEWAAAYKNASATELLKFEMLQGTAPRYVLASPHYEPDLALLQKSFKMHLVFESTEEKTKLWRLDPLLH